MKVSLGSALSVTGRDAGEVNHGKNEQTMFEEVLMNTINNANDLQNNADSSAVSLAVGAPVNLHSVMIDAQKAEIALQFTMQIRNKVIDAYNEIMRMQI